MEKRSVVSHQFSVVCYQYPVHRSSVYQFLTGKPKTGKLVSENRKLTTDYRICVFAFLFFISFFSIHTYAYADSTYVPANYYPISGKVVEGNIVSFVDGKYILSTAPYDQFMIGTITNNPAITQDISGPLPYYPVINSGDGFVLVTATNGSIKKGDYITTSAIPGVGQKATKAGYTIGVAEDNFNTSNKKAIGKIPISLNIHYFIGNAKISSNFLDIFALSTLATYESPSLVVKYILTTIVVVMSIFFSFVQISKTANKGIDALGRNPLSSFEIQVGIALNVFIGIMILGTGVVMGLLILRL